MRESIDAILLGEKRGQHINTRLHGETLADTGNYGEGRFLLGEKRGQHSLTLETTEKEDFYRAKKGDDTWEQSKCNSSRILDENSSNDAFTMYFDEMFSAVIANYHWFILPNRRVPILCRVFAIPVDHMRSLLYSSLWSHRGTADGGRRGAAPADAASGGGGGGGGCGDISIQWRQRRQRRQRQQQQHRQFVQFFIRVAQPHGIGGVG